MSKIWYFFYVNNKIDNIRHLACIQSENRNAVACDCRDVAIYYIFWDNSNSKSHRVPIPSIMNEKKFSNRCLFLKAKGKTKSNHKVLGLWQRSLRIHDVIDFFTLLAVYILRIRTNQNNFVANRYSLISCIKDKSIATSADVTRLLL